MRLHRALDASTLIRIRAYRSIKEAFQGDTPSFDFSRCLFYPVLLLMSRLLLT